MHGAWGKLIAGRVKSAKLAFWRNELGRIRVCRIALSRGEVAELTIDLLEQLLERRLTTHLACVGFTPACIELV